MTEILSDEEIRTLTLWETDSEIPAFKMGWCYRREHGPRETAPVAKELTENLGQNERVAWERGWLAANAVYELLFQE
jgi:hypothetical protein